MSRFATILSLFLIAEPAMSQNTMGPITNNQGIITQGQIGNNTIIQAPVRAQFNDQIKDQILQQIPRGQVHLQTIGNDADQAIGNEVQQFLAQNGYSVQRAVIGMLAPPPSGPWTLNKDGPVPIFIVAPSAR